MVFSMLVITGIFGGIMQDTRIFIAGGTLTPVSYTHLDVYKRQNVEYLCIKDMSRMGRDYLKVGQIMEILRQRGVRLIAINDGVDKMCIRDSRCAEKNRGILYQQPGRV